MLFKNILLYILTNYDQFLFKLQVPIGYNILCKHDDIAPDKIRGWCYEDDKAIISITISRGYDNFTFKERSRMR